MATVNCCGDRPAVNASRDSGSLVLGDAGSAVASRTRPKKPSFGSSGSGLQGLAFNIGRIPGRQSGPSPFNPRQTANLAGQAEKAGLAAPAASVAQLHNQMSLFVFFYSSEMARSLLRGTHKF
jgi:hypothetical protein